MGAASYFVWQKYFNRKTIETQETQKLSLDPQKVKTHLSKVANTENAYWMRGGFNLLWNEVEKQKGRFDWSLIDERIKELNKQEVYVIPIVQPFVNWDQDTCHFDAKYEAETLSPEGVQKIKVGKPCDMTAYANFLTKAVERYDGDGENDMPGLIIPIKY